VYAHKNETIDVITSKMVAPSKRVILKTKRTEFEDTGPYSTRKKKFIKACT
jgi:hypothetical protein